MTKRKLTDIRFDLGADKKWLAPFIKGVVCVSGKKSSDVLREAFCLHFLGKVSGLANRKSCVERESWDKFLIRIPREHAYLSAEIERLTKLKKVSPAALFFEAFCEVYGKKDSKLRDKYSKWQELRGM